MKLINLKIVFSTFIALSLIPFLGFAQLDNSSFYPKKELLSFSDSSSKINQRQINLEIDYFGFFRNKEFFENIADGYTLFGSQFLSKLSYSADTTIKVSAGIFLRKDFGSGNNNGNFNQIQPYFQFLYKKNKHQFIFGNLEGNLQHNLIEPLFNFEKIINRRLENGVQYKYLSKNTSLDTWIDWVTMIYPYSDFDEELHFGLNIERNIFASKNWKSTIPVQLTAIHKGGQINTTGNPLITVFNAAIGNKTTYYFGNDNSDSYLKYIRTHLYGVFFIDNSSVPSFTFENGMGIYANLELATKKHQLMFSYWRGQDFVAPLGGDIYSSASRIFAPNTQDEPLRNLLILRVLTNFSLPNIAKDDAKIVFRAIPYYNLETQELNFSTGLYATFNTNFLLKGFKN
ncbi:hypothetical protein Fleli_2787 [Bernardetia litoralis DSM 6794]|uniref:Uncharacterized protein n=1 Tax=Bernardetia litoralis (strain ATCC 23117 / DSM 6794 / NBRC 15988 / NCIMB 1366 / Fx l1 / Sio-4) TaxID=880071 RepID=I4AMF5_BERLS|nr:hypothetical protein [Bernardetia litoralis]AFM05140.1 hypothetical protein Fleli_2787 [Bernardetia litoralis DSM 6794]